MDKQELFRRMDALRMLGVAAVFGCWWLLVQAIAGGSGGHG